MRALALPDLSIEHAAAALREGSTTAVALTEAVLDRIEAWDGEVNAFLTVDQEGALEQARTADARLARGEGGPLCGVPLAVKDNMVTAGLHTTCACRLLEGYRPPVDAFAVAALRRAGAVLVGKTNLDEFAMGSSTENSAFGPTRNPWDRERVPGGSSGGSAAAVVYGGSLGALGSDTGGSIRQPASFCGVVGLRPTYGRVSRRGLIAMASSLDQIGPLTRTVRDAAVMLQAIGGHDTGDATSSSRPVPDYLAGIEDGVAGLRIGVARSLLDSDDVHPGLAGVVDSAGETLASEGAELVEDVALPHLRHAVATYYVLCAAESSANLARYDGIRYGSKVRGETLWESYRRTRGRKLGPEVVRRIVLGAFTLSTGYHDAYYQRANRVRALIAHDFERVFADCDALLMPVTLGPAFALGELADDPLRLYLTDLFTVGASLARLPALSLPAGELDGLPQGVQLVAAPFAEEKLLRVAQSLERATAGSLERRLEARGWPFS